MDNPTFWAAIIGFLTAATGVLTALRARFERRRVEDQSKSDLREATLREQLERERKEAAEREREAAQRERQTAQEALAFREDLRKEALNAVAVLSTDVKGLGDTLAENTRVMERAIDLAERVIEREAGRDPALRTRTTDRTSPRRSTRPNRCSGGRSDGQPGTGRGQAGSSR